MDRALPRDTRRPRAGGVAAPRVVRRFPAVCLVATPYLALVLPIAMVNGSPHLWYVCGLLGVAVLGCLVSEMILPPLRDWARWRADVAAACALGRPLWMLAVVVITVSSVARLVYIGTGSGSISATVNGTGGGPVAALASMFSTWPFVGVGLLLACKLGGCVSNLRLAAGLVTITVVEVVAVFYSQKAAGLAHFALPVTLTALLFGLARLRLLAVLYAGLLIVWPTWYSIRNASREGAGVWVDHRVTPFERLRFDEQMGVSQRFDIPVDLGQPGLGELLRFAVLPRTLDPDRGTLQTGTLINQALGGSSTSAFNFLSIGTVYFFYGILGLFLAYFFLSALLTMFWRAARTSGPIAVCGIMLTAAMPLSWAATFPDILAGYGQSLIALIPIGVALIVIKRRCGRSRPVPGRLGVGDPGLGDIAIHPTGTQRHELESS